MDNKRTQKPVSLSEHLTPNPNQTDHYLLPIAGQSISISESIFIEQCLLSSFRYLFLFARLSRTQLSRMSFETLWRDSISIGANSHTRPAHPSICHGGTAKIRRLVGITWLFKTTTGLGALNKHWPRFVIPCSLETYQVLKRSICDLADARLVFTAKYSVR